MIIMSKKSRLDDPAYAQFAWARYWKLMRWMGGAALFAVIVAFIYIYYSSEAGNVTIHMYIATALGVFFSVLLGAALMGLVFLSSGTGHDEAVEDQLDQEMGPDGPYYNKDKD